MAELVCMAVVSGRPSPGRAMACEPGRTEESPATAPTLPPAPLPPLAWLPWRSIGWPHAWQHSARDVHMREPCTAALHSATGALSAGHRDRGPVVDREGVLYAPAIPHALSL